MHNVFLLLGGNLGNPTETLQQATLAIEQQIGAVVAKSSLYESEPWGFTHANNFVNQVLHISSTLSPEQILELTQSIEKELGRTAKTTSGYEGRLIDIDILMYDKLIINFPWLHVPHLRMHERRFTLLPLIEIAPNLEHSVFRKTMTELLTFCKDRGDVVRIEQ